VTYAMVGLRPPLLYPSLYSTFTSSSSLHQNSNALPLPTASACPQRTTSASTPTRMVCSAALSWGATAAAP